MGWADSAINIGAEKRITKQSSNPKLVCSVHLNASAKGIHLSLLHRLNNGVNSFL